jgi:hypothetical protein
LGRTSCSLILQKRKYKKKDMTILLVWDKSNTFISPNPGRTKVTRSGQKSELPRTLLLFIHLFHNPENRTWFLFLNIEHYPNLVLSVH